MNAKIIYHKRKPDTTSKIKEQQFSVNLKKLSQFTEEDIATGYIHHGRVIIPFILSFILWIKSMKKGKKTRRYG